MSPREVRGLLRLAELPIGNPRGGVRPDPHGLRMKSPHVFITTGLARLWKGGIPGEWFVMPAEDPRDQGGRR